MIFYAPSHSPAPRHEYPRTNEAQPPLSKMEEVLVKEFRTCQSLYKLTRDERQALARGEAGRLLILSKRKDVLSKRLGDLESERQSIQLEMQRRETEPSGIDLLEGIHILRASLREVVRGNQALADAALRQTNNNQAALVGVFQAPEEWNIDSLVPLPAVVAAGLEMRQAIHTADQSAAALALERMEDALDQLGSYLERRGAPLLPETKPAYDLWNSPVSVTGIHLNLNWAEMIANLYHQSAAYQAVLQTNQYLLAAVNLEESNHLLKNPGGKRGQALL